MKVNNTLLFPKGQKGIKFSIALLLLFLAIVFYAIAFFSNEWFIVNPSHYGIWSVTFCDMLTCQAIPTIFNDQPGWYLFVQLFNVVGFVSTVSSFIMLFWTVLVSKVFCQLSVISTTCQVAAFSILAGMITFFASLVTECQMSLPVISWAASLAGISCILEVTAFVLLVQ